MMNAGTWMMEGYGRGSRGGMWSNHMGGDFDMFGPMSLMTVSVLFLLALLWTVAIKGYALWQAAKRGEKWWFIALLVINTFGILELAYLIFVAKLWPKKGSVENKGSSQEKQQVNTQEKHHEHGMSGDHAHTNNHQA